jgi:hypothetical protein
MIDLSPEDYAEETRDPGYPELSKAEPFDPDILGPWAHQRALAREHLLAELERDLNPAALQAVLVSLDEFDQRVEGDVAWINGYYAARCATNVRILGRPAPGRPRRGGSFDCGYATGLRDAARRMESWNPDLAEALFEEAELDDKPTAANPWRNVAPLCPSCGTAEWVLCYDPDAATGRWICIRDGHQGAARFDGDGYES